MSTHHSSSGPLPGEATVEESLLGAPGSPPRRLIDAGGFGEVVDTFDSTLHGLRRGESADAAAEQAGRSLWDFAIDRAQGRRASGQLHPNDDRPLYWARLMLITMLRGWASRHRVDPPTLQEPMGLLERFSRGEEQLAEGEHSMPQVIITGFDPFRLTREVRRSNPSGAAALALDRTTVTVGGERYCLRAALFPVRWADFTAGLVERTLLPVLTDDPEPVMFCTLSQGRPDGFDLEAVNGAWRGGGLDNAGVRRSGTVPIPAGVPTVLPQPQWTRSTLPTGAMASAATGSSAVVDNRTVVEVPAGSADGTEVRSDDGPTPGSIARAGGGGDYLSNEIAYRATLLRDALGVSVPGGHIHTPVLTGLDADSLSTPEFDHNRESIIDQTKQLIIAGLAARSGGTAG